jgi:hypothetical protein
MRIFRHVDAGREVFQPRLTRSVAVTAPCPVGNSDPGTPVTAKNRELGTAAETSGTAANIATWVYEGGAGGEVRR